MDSARSPWSFPAIVVLACFIGSPPTRAGSMYNFTRIEGPPGSDAAYVKQINDRGQILGDDFIIEPNGVAIPFGSGREHGVAMNNRGEVVGISSDPAIGPFIYHEGIITPVKSLGPYQKYGFQPLAINDSGLVVGLGRRAIPHSLGRGEYEERAGELRDGVVADIGVWSNGAAIGINNQGHKLYNALGWLMLSTDKGAYYPHLIDPNSATFNSSDVVIGQSENFNDIKQLQPNHAVSWKEDKYTDLGTLGGQQSRAYGINDAGVIVGQSQVTDSTDHAFIYQDGRMTDLNGLADLPEGLTLNLAKGINNLGQIIGTGEDADHHPFGFLLTPTTSDSTTTPIPAPVPEPSVLALFGLAGAVAWLRRRRRS